MHLSRMTMVGVLAFALAACNTDAGNKQIGGTLLGAGLGALAGSQVGGGKGQLAAVAVGALAGAWLGSEAGKSLDKADEAYSQRTAQNTLEHNQTGQTASWRNPDSGNSGSYTPTRTYVSEGGLPCREFETTVTIDGREERAYGRACRQPNNTWKIVQ